MDTATTKYCPHFLLLFIAASGMAVAQPRVERNIDSDWKFSRENAPGAERSTYDDSYWEKISIPHTWNARDGQDGGNDYYRGTAWYRRQLRLEKRLRDKCLFLKFDGAATTTQVYVNGKRAGTHKGNFGAFCFEITSLVKFDAENVLAVRVSNARDTTVTPLRGDFTVFGGIYRGVHLLALENLSISPLDYASSGIYVRQARVNQDSAELEITTVVRNASRREKHATIRCLIANETGKIVQAAESALVLSPGSERNAVQGIVLRTPHLWNGRSDPYSYRVRVEVMDGKRVTDRVVQPLGLRFFSVDAQKGFLLNGRPYPLHGVNRHQDRLNLGWAIGVKEHREDYKLIEEIGCTAVRLAHYQQAQEFYDLCDRGGMVVWAELALVDQIHPCAEFAAGCEEQLKELIKQNFNHPSIMFWSMYNELIPDTAPDLYGRVVDSLNILAHRLDPSRLTTMASRGNYDGTSYINTVTDLIGYNVYKGWYEGNAGEFAPYVDSLHARFPRQRICISEYGAGAGVTQHEFPASKHAARGRWHPEEWQASLHETIWNAMAVRPFLWGTFVWNMFDFASDSRDEGELPGRNDKGLVTYDRKTKKDAYYWYKANWNAEPMVYIAGRRYSPRPAGHAEVKIYSNCDSVALVLNGKPAGVKKSGERRYVWSDVELVGGKNVVEAVGFSGGKEIKDSCTWLTESGGNVLR